MQRSLHQMVEMLQQQQQQIAELRSEMARQRAVSSNINQLSMRLDSMSSSITDRVAEVLQGQHQLDCILCCHFFHCWHCVVFQDTLTLVVFLIINQSATGLVWRHANQPANEKWPRLTTPHPEHLPAWWHVQPNFLSGWQKLVVVDLVA